MGNSRTENNVIKYPVNVLKARYTQSLPLFSAAMLITFIVLLECRCHIAADHRCIFDDIQKKGGIAKTHVNYGSRSISGALEREKRSSENPYEPIRITVLVQDDEHLMDAVQVSRLNDIMAGAVSIVRKVFAVYPVAGNLVMERSETACRQFHLLGPNSGKCATISPTYQEECLDDFVIPDDHLGGLWTWDSTDPEPITEFPVGAGIPDTDTVLYVKAEHTDQCNSGDVLAYASYCKQDQYSRPIAGVINFCPDPLLSDQYDQEKFTVLALHETFHVLGFSQSLFDHFQECTPCLDGLECEQREDVVMEDSSGGASLHSPAVLAAAQLHFGCYDEGRGVPLENLGSDGASSHWEMRLMYGSIMAPLILQPHSTFLDNLTLAVFEDSGWYKVNFDYAEDFPWGKGQGCDFGMPELCATNFSDFYCNGSASRCDVYHLNKATCTTNDYLDGCRVFLPAADSQCTALVDSKAESGGENFTGEVAGPESRCFIGNTLAEGTCTPGEMEGRCYTVRCDVSAESYNIRLSDSDWLPCPAGEHIQVPGYDGAVLCPPAEVVCRNHSYILSLVDPPCLTCTSPPASTSPKSASETPPADDINLTLEFNDMEYSDVDEMSEVIAFKGILTQGIVDVANLPESRIDILNILPGSVRVVVCITEEASAEVSAGDAYSILSTAVGSGEFCIQYKNVNYSASSVSLVDMTSTLPSPPLPPNGSPTPPASTPPPPDGSSPLFSPLTIAMLSIVAAIFLTTFVALCIWKNKKTALTVGPAPTPRGTTPSREGGRPGEMYIVHKPGERARILKKK